MTSWAKIILQTLFYSKKKNNTQLRRHIQNILCICLLQHINEATKYDAHGDLKILILVAKFLLHNYIKWNFFKDDLCIIQTHPPSSSVTYLILKMLKFCYDFTI